MKGDLKVNGLAMECDIVMSDTIKMFGGRTDWTKECLVLDLSQSGRDHAREELCRGFDYFSITESVVTSHGPCAHCTGTRRKIGTLSYLSGNKHHKPC